MNLRMTHDKEFMVPFIDGKFLARDDYMDEETVKKFTNVLMSAIQDKTKTHEETMQLTQEILAKCPKAIEGVQQAYSEISGTKADEALLELEIELRNLRSYMDFGINGTKRDYPNAKNLINPMDGSGSVIDQYLDDLIDFANVKNFARNAQKMVLARIAEMNVQQGELCVLSDQLQLVIHEQLSSIKKIPSGECIADIMEVMTEIIDKVNHTYAKDPNWEEYEKLCSNLKAVLVGLYKQRIHWEANSVLPADFLESQEYNSSDFEETYYYCRLDSAKPLTKTEGILTDLPFLYEALPNRDDVVPPAKAPKVLTHDLIELYHYKERLKVMQERFLLCDSAPKTQEEKEERKAFKNEVRKCRIMAEVIEERIQKKAISDIKESLARSIDEF